LIRKGRIYFFTKCEGRIAELPSILVEKNKIKRAFYPGVSLAPCFCQYIKSSVVAWFPKKVGIFFAFITVLLLPYQLTRV